MKVTFKFSGLQGWLSMSRAVNPIPKHCLLKAKITKIDKSTFIAICIDFDFWYRKNIQEVLYLQTRVNWTSLFFQVFAHINKTYVHCINFHAILIPMIYITWIILLISCETTQGFIAFFSISMTYSIWHDIEKFENSNGYWFF